jgi:hypothetical protein
LSRFPTSISTSQSVWRFLGKKSTRLPSKIVKIVPAYEGYEYFVLADGRIVIVDPNTYKIVLVLT